MSQHTGSHKNSLNLLDEKYLNESYWPMHRIRLLECRAYCIYANRYETGFFKVSMSTENIIHVRCIV